MSGKILVADDDRKINELLRDILEMEGYEVSSAYDGQETLQMLEYDPHYDLLLLDVMMPKLDGWDVLGYIKEHFDVKVLMLTALDDEFSEVRGLREGADDYVAKPFRRAVLLERVRKLISVKQHSDLVDYCCEELVLSQKNCVLAVRGEVCHITPKEYQLLLLLMKNCNVALSRDVLMERIWGTEYDGGERTLDTHIKMLRRSLGEYGGRIRTIRGIGYCFDGEVVKR